MGMIMMSYQHSDKILLHIILLDTFICIIYKKQSDINEARVWQVLASKPAVIVLNFAGLKLYQYLWQTQILQVSRQV
jgi:hypothetical protein